MRRSVRIQGLVIIALTILTLGVWYTIFREDRGDTLTVSFLNVGQGDSIFIDAPSGRQVLIDGGRGRAVLRELSHVMPWYDRSIDVVIPTHPDQDHIGGLVDVLARYRIGIIVHSSVEGDTATAQALVESMKQEGAEDVTAMRGQIIDLGGSSTGSELHAYLEVLFPDRLVPRVETNTGSVVVRLVYGKTAFMLTGDSPQAIEKYLVRLDGSTPLTASENGLKSDVLKAGHHGSKTSSSELFVGFVGPQYAVFSRGCDNSYGHPHPEVVALFKRFEISTFDTCKDGTITFVSDGNKVERY